MDEVLKTVFYGFWVVIFLYLINVFTTMLAGNSPVEVSVLFFLGICYIFGFVIKSFLSEIEKRVGERVKDVHNKESYIKKEEG